MRTPFVLWCIFMTVIGVNSQGRQASVEIFTPKDGALVDSRLLVEGKSSSPDAEVWVIVHPTEVSNYWIQPRVTVRGNGQWTVQVYVGRPGDIDMTKKFELLAVANPKEHLREGEVLASWPEAEAHSDAIVVIRK